MCNHVIRFLLIIILVFAFPIQTHAIGVNASKYFNSGYIYSGSKYPQSVANNTENTNSNEEANQTKNDTNKQETTHFGRSNAS